MQFLMSLYNKLIGRIDKCDRCGTKNVYPLNVNKYTCCDNCNNVWARHTNPNFPDLIAKSELPDHEMVGEFWWYGGYNTVANTVKIGMGKYTSISVAITILSHEYNHWILLNEVNHLACLMWDNISGNGEHDGYLVLNNASWDDKI